jgi:hypothetical protein
VEHFVLENGRAFAPRRLPKEFHARTRGYCFWNARQLAIENPDQLRYVEGIACEGSEFEPHAWNIDKGDCVVDSTWGWGDANEYNNPKAYFGVIFPLEIVMLAVTVKNVIGSPVSYEGVLDDQINFWPLLKEKYSEARALEILRAVEKSKR